MFFAIFNGISRGIGNKPTKEVYLKVGVDFRNYLHHFKGAKLAIFMAICLHMDEHGRSFPSYDTLMELTGLNRSTVAKAIKELQTTLIDGQPVLGVSRERDKLGRLKGNNHYCLFPTDEEAQSLENPTLEKPNYRKPILEVEPYVKEEPIRKKNNGGGNSSVSNNPPPPPSKTTAAVDNDSFIAINAALTTINNRLKKPFTGLPELTNTLIRNGKTVEDVKALWGRCQGKNNPAGAFIHAIKNNFDPTNAPAPTASASTTKPQYRRNPTTGEIEEWVGTGWGKAYGVGEEVLSA